MRNRIVLRIARILHKPNPNDSLSRWFSIALVSLILVNAAAVAIETVPSINREFGAAFQVLEIISTVLFAIEYLLRVGTCTLVLEGWPSASSRIKYMLRPLVIVDFLVVVTFFVPILDLRFLRIIRIGRLLHVLRLDEYDVALKAITAAIKKRKPLLVISVVFMLLTIYAAAAALYFVEHTVQPEAFGTIPDALWWAIISLTTIGYGDAVPVTIVGKLLTCFIAVGGIGIFALPSAIITAAVVEAANLIDQKAQYATQKKN